MIMPDDKKKSATIILAKMKGKDDYEKKETPTSEDGTEMDSSIGYDAACEEMLKAIESKDAKALKESLRSVIDMVMSEDSSED